MSRYIDRGSFLQLLAVYFSIPHCNPDYEAGVLKVEKMLEAYPSADVEPVRHGHWVAQYYETLSARNRIIHQNKLFCSVCKKSNGRQRKKYCPNCGAKMDGENENHN